MRLLLLFFFAFSLISGFSQNLVPNPSFETITRCPAFTSEIARAVNWNRPPGSRTTPDLYSSCFVAGPTPTCFDVGVPANFAGNANAFNGNNYAGIMCYYGVNNQGREYIQTQLTSPMLANMRYCVSFRIRRSSFSKFAIDGIGMHISNGALVHSQGYNAITTVTPQIQANSIVRDSANWTLISGTYIATGGESHITIGNFQDNAGTAVFTGVSTSPCPLANNTAYYYIDSVSVEACPVPPPVASFSATPNILCEGECIGFTDLSTNAPTDWLWHFEGANIASSTNQHPANVCYATAGVYTATLIVSNSGGADTTTRIITVNPYPVAAITGAGLVCPGGNASLTASPAGGSYLWDNGANTQVITPRILSPGVYTVTVTVGGCSDVTSFSVDLYELPEVSFSANDTVGCPELCVEFNNTSPVSASQVWNMGDGVTTNQHSPRHCYVNSGLYSISLTVTDNNGCSNTLIKNNYVNVLEKPNANFTYTPENPTMYNGTVFFIDQSTGASSWQWISGNLSTPFSSIQNPYYTYDDTGTFAVTLIVTNDLGCTDSITKNIRVADELLLFAPNTFTPNGDGLNDVFRVSVLGALTNNFELFIFDRWGSLIYQTNDINKPWDGRANNGTGTAQIDVYVWKIKLKDTEGKPHLLTGQVNLIR